MLKLFRTLTRLFAFAVFFSVLVLGLATATAYWTLNRLDGQSPDDFELTSSARLPLELSAQFFYLRQPEPAEDVRAGEVVQDCDYCPEMVIVPSGFFLIGSPLIEFERYDQFFLKRRSIRSKLYHANREGPRRVVGIAAPLAIGRTETTIAEWNRAQADPDWERLTGLEPRPVESGPEHALDAVGGMDWNSANAYAIWLSARTGTDYRLLSEAEWEYAARAGTVTRYSWGNDVEPGQVICNGCGGEDDQSLAGPGPVAQFAPNAFGLFDMHGNGWEWVEDCYLPYLSATIIDGSAITGTDCEFRSLRGGAAAEKPSLMRSAFRFNPHADNDSSPHSFRLARQLPSSN